MKNFKIKDIDADVELLTKRKKLEKIMCLATLIIAMMTVIYSMFSSTVYFYLISGMLLVVLALFFWVDVCYYNILIVIKRTKEKE